MMSRVAFEVVYAQKEKAKAALVFAAFAEVIKKWMILIGVIVRALSSDHVYTAITSFSLVP